MAGFHLQSFFASSKVLPCRYLLQTPPFYLLSKSWQIRSKLPCPATTPPAMQSGTQGQTGRKKRRTFLARLFFVLLILLSLIRKSYHFLVKYPLLSCVRLQFLPAILLFGRTHRIKLSCVLCLCKVIGIGFLLFFLSCHPVL